MKLQTERKENMNAIIDFNIFFAEDEAYEKYMKEHGLVPLWRGGDKIVEGEFETKTTKLTKTKRHFWFNAEKVTDNLIHFDCSCQRVKI